MPTPPRRCVRTARLLLADDHALARSGLRAMLAPEPDLQVVGEARDGAEALRLCRDVRPDLVPISCAVDTTTSTSQR